MSWYFWIDRGGTFTDIVARHPAGHFITLKVLSERWEALQQDAAVMGIRHVLGLSPTESIPKGLVAGIRMGTTVATNALLEKKGEAVLLVTNRGFGDILDIGTQNRPSIFARAIHKNPPLYHDVLELKGRISANGEELEPLDLDEAESGMQAAMQRGMTSCAIVLMHSYRYPEHERVLGELASKLGYQHISLSSVVDPLQKIVSRGSTTVVDAYLSPILHRYLDRLTQELGASTPLLFMQSGGGLADREHFQGKDSLLSGPAGGLLGAQRVATEAGFQRFISFDMGGTSTDVALFDGHSFERFEETQIAGVPVRTSLFAIHTVAAGGGSVCQVRDGRLQVGPASAGSKPGPACYRQGGPLTITDCHVFLGRIQIAYFPAVFGKEANESLDRSESTAALLECSERLKEQSQIAMDPEDLARGFLSIADENMAEAIRRISIQRGQNPADYVLLCFGGAAGQHACRVAERLKMSHILIHPWAGVLSAYGIGCAPLRWMQKKAVEAPLHAEMLAELENSWTTLEQSGREALIQQGADPQVITLQRRVSLSYQGSDAQLLLDIEPLPKLIQAFARKHRHNFGFDWPDRPLILVSLEVEALAYQAVADFPTPPQGQRQKPLAPLEYIRLCSGRGWQEVPLFQTKDLQTEDVIQGPAIIIEPLSTIVLEEGWQMTRGTQGTLHLNRIHSFEASATALDAFDPVQLEIFHRRFQAIAEHMGTTLAQTAQSVNIKERLDFSCAIFDSSGDLVANAPHVPVHLGSMDASVKCILHQYGNQLRPGDVYALNDPYQGGTHLPDITVITPIFTSDTPRPAFFVASRGHHADIGGLSPGSMPPHSHSIEEEGIWIRGMRLVQDGVFQETSLVEALSRPPYPARRIAQNIADIQAQVAANNTGVHEMKRLLSEYGQTKVEWGMQAIQDHAAACVQRLIRSMKPGRFECEADGGWFIRVSLEVDPAEGKVIIDFSGTSPQRSDNFNAPEAVVRAVVLYVLRILVDEDIPLNSGCLRHVTIRIPEGSMLAPRYPAAVVAGNVETSQLIADTLLGALGAMAASQGTMNNLTFGNERYQYYETIAGGSGAGPGFAGASAVQTHMTNSRMTDPEVIETRFPVRIECFAIRQGSGGFGTFSGGAGIIRRIRFLDSMQVAILSNRRRVTPFGLQGGHDGSSGRQWIERRSGIIENLQGSDLRQVEPGDALQVETPGGGGYGRPAPDI